MQHVADFTECSGIVLGECIAAGDQGGSVEKESGRITVERIRPEGSATHGRDGEDFLDR